MVIPQGNNTENIDISCCATLSEQTTSQSSHLLVNIRERVQLRAHKPY